MRARTTIVGATSVLLAALAASPSTVLAATPTPAVLHVGQIDRQDIPPVAGSEHDTLVEPDVAVSPVDTRIAIAAAHDGRFPNGGAVDISYAWTHDGGANWHHAPVDDLTKATGGAWDRASDPVVAFGPDGSAYLSALVFNATTCATGVAVLRSTDGGATFGAPVLAQQSTRCSYSDDKNWLVVDTQPGSPHDGRLYQFWTAFISQSGHFVGSPQVVRWSDDHGATWSTTHNVAPDTESTQDSQPLIQRDGSITDVYLGPGTSMVARTSHDGGRTWSAETTVTTTVSPGPISIRCCLPGAAADPVTGELYAVWIDSGRTRSAQRRAVVLSHSSDGVTWSRATTVAAAPQDIQHVNVAVTAYGGRVFVSYGTRNLAVDSGYLVQQQVSASYDGGRHFGTAISLGPASDLRYAAVAGGRFPGDYIGASAVANRVVLVWCVSSKPTKPGAKFHQVLFAATLRP